MIQSDIDVEFEIEMERRKEQRIVRGYEFDCVFEELAKRLETLENDFKVLKEQFEELKAKP